MMPATTLPCVLDPNRSPSQDDPSSSTFWTAWIFRWLGDGNGWLKSPTCVAVCEKWTASAVMPLSVTATICGGTCAVPLLRRCRRQRPPPVQLASVVQARVGLFVQRSAPLPPPSIPSS